MKGKKGNRIKVNLFIVLMAFSIIPLLLSISVISVTSIYFTKDNLEDAAKETLYVVANDLANHCNQNKINYATAETYHDYIDGLVDKNLEMAIILNDAPCVSSIKNANGYRIREIPVKDEILETIDTLENGYYDEQVIIDGKTYFAYYMPITVDNEIVGLAFAGELQENVTGATKDIILNFVLIAVALVVLFALITLLFCNVLLKSFTAINQNVEALSRGDLKRRKEKHSSIKEMNLLLKATKMMQENLSQTIGNVKNVSHRLAESVLDVTKLSQNSSEHAGDIAAAIQEVSAAAIEMDANIQNINMQMQEIGVGINEISGSVDHLYSSSENILQTNNEAKESMDTIMHNSHKSVEAVNDITVQIKETNDAITEIDMAVELILSIAEQTSLLSLNASIEAARAGTFGRGFAVVADEIRKLSEQSSEGAEMIKNIAKTIVEKSEKSVQLAEEVHSLILEEQENVSNTQEKYVVLSGEIGQSVSEIRAIAQKTDHLTEYKEKAIESVQKLSRISEINTANNEQVNENIEQIVSGVQNVNVNCAKMNHMAQELEESISYFQDEAETL